MLYEKIYFDDNDKDAYLEAYISDKVGSFVCDAMLVIPGGGYSCVCSDREGEPIALAFIPHGYNSFVLHYSVNKKPFPYHLIQASRAIKYIKDNAERLNINPERVFTVGFSAGGHLAASLGTMWQSEEIYKNIDMPYGYNKPRGMMLIYPVISAKHHGFTFKNLLMKENCTEEELAACSIENHITADCSPAYIFHTSNDEVVNVKNSLALANALAENEIKFEMHIYPDAPHGVALGNEITADGSEKWNNPCIAKWVENAAAWAKNI